MKCVASRVSTAAILLMAASKCELAPPGEPAGVDAGGVGGGTGAGGGVGSFDSGSFDAGAYDAGSFDAGLSDAGCGLGLVFDDEFDGANSDGGESLDLTKWRRGVEAWSSVPADSIVTGGHLRLRSRGRWNGVSTTAVSYVGSVNTSGTFAIPPPTSARSGVLVEGKLRFAINDQNGFAGPGWWPMWWWIDQDPNGYFEVDMLESFGNAAEAHPHLHVHIGGQLKSFGRWSNNAAAYGWPTPDASPGVTTAEVGATVPWVAAYHTYAAAWGIDPATGLDFLSWFYDGVEVFHLSPIPGDLASKTTKTAYLILAQGKATPETAPFTSSQWHISADTDFPSYMDVDYVRVYQGPTECLLRRARRPR